MKNILQLCAPKSVYNQVSVAPENDTNTHVDSLYDRTGNLELSARSHTKAKKKPSKDFSIGKTHSLHEEMVVFVVNLEFRKPAFENVVETMQFVEDLTCYTYDVTTILMPPSILIAVMMEALAPTSLVGNASSNLAVRLKTAARDHALLLRNFVNATYEGSTDNHDKHNGNSFLNVQKALIVSVRSAILIFPIQSSLLACVLLVLFHVILFCRTF